MKKKRFEMVAAWVAVVVLAACNGQSQPKNTGEQDVDGFYSSAAVRQTTVAEPEQARAAETTAQVVRMYEIPACLADRPEQIMKRQGYTVSYNQTTKTPNWVAWHLTKNHTYGKVRREEQSFAEDGAVAAPRATLDDYYNSRYDRGHMCPAGDNKWSEEAMSQTFLLTNICPQNHGLNKNAWNDLEMQCREWAREFGAVDIVCGPIYRGASYSGGKMTASPSQRYIGSHRVWVPDAFFKVVLCRKGSPKAIGFVYENRGGQQTMSRCVKTVDEIERMTGLDFFPELDDATERRIEAVADLERW